MKTFCDLNGDVGLSKRLTVEAQMRLAKLGGEDLRSAIGKRPEGMSRLAYIRFRVLHRQLRGNKTPGFPSAVKTGRALARKIKSWRSGSR